MFECQLQIQIHKDGLPYTDTRTDTSHTFIHVRFDCIWIVTVFVSLLLFSCVEYRFVMCYDIVYCVRAVWMCNVMWFDPCMALFRCAKKAPFQIDIDWIIIMDGNKYSGTCLLTTIQTNTPNAKCNLVTFAHVYWSEYLRLTSKPFISSLRKLASVDYPNLFIIIFVIDSMEFVCYWNVSYWVTKINK